MIDTQQLPEARITRRSWWSWTWVIPLAAILVGGVLGYQAWSARGLKITIRFDHGHGLRAGDPVQHRGVQIGAVSSVRLATGTSGIEGVETTIELWRGNEGLARDGSRFWIVRPEVSLARVAGLETIVGPRYIEAEPSSTGAPTVVFDGLASAPPSTDDAPDGLSIVLETDRVGSLTIGSPVTFREYEVGRVERLTLERSGERVLVSARINARWTHLVRSNSRFWNVSGIGVDVAFTGLKVRAESLASVVNGGVSFATPNSPGEQARAGERFELASEAESAWLKWSPDLSAGGPTD